MPDKSKLLGLGKLVPTPCPAFAGTVTALASAFATGGRLKMVWDMTVPQRLKMTDNEAKTDKHNYEKWLDSPQLNYKSTNEDKEKSMAITRQKFVKALERRKTTKLKKKTTPKWESWILGALAVICFSAAGIAWKFLK
jgi:hypothetical protein